MKTRAQAEQEARAIVNKWVTGAAIGGWIPGSTLVFAGADLVMIRQVAAAFEVGKYDPESVGAAVAGATAGGVAGGVIAEGVGWVPVIGWAVKSTMMAAKARIIGNVVIDYFKERSPLSQ